MAAPIEDAVGSHAIVAEEFIVGNTRWVCLRSRGAEYSFLTPKEAALLAVRWLQKYGNRLS